MMQNNFRTRGGPKRFLVFIFFILLMALVLGALVMWLWNAILPELLNVKAINYWQAVGLVVLCKILFGNFRPPAGQGPQYFGKPDWRKKWMGMNDAEKEKFKEEWRKRCERPKE